MYTTNLGFTIIWFGSRYALAFLTFIEISHCIVDTGLPYRLCTNFGIPCHMVPLPNNAFLVQELLSCSWRGSTCITTRPPAANMFPGYVFCIYISKFTYLISLPSSEGFGSGSVLDPFSGIYWIWIRISNTNPDPGVHNSLFLCKGHKITDPYLFWNAVSVSPDN